MKSSLSLSVFISALALSSVLAAELARPTADSAEPDPSLSSDGNTPLHLAALRGDAHAVEVLLESGADPSAMNHAGATPLHYGVGNERIVAALLARGAPANVISKRGVTPLLGAVTYANAYAIVQRLIDAGADVNHRGRTPGPEVVPFGLLASAARRGDPRVITLLIDQGAQVNPPDGPLPITTAALTGNLEVTKLLLARGADPNHRSGSAGLPLGAAVQVRHYDVARLLLEHGADPNTRWIDRRRTPPMVFSGYNDTGDTRLARLLVEHGAVVNAADDYGDTALSYAVQRGSDTPLVAYLREIGIRPTTPTRPDRGKVIPSRAVPNNGEARESMLREGVQRAIDLIQPSSRKFLANPLVRDQRQCISCHHEALPTVSYGLARERGLRVEPFELGRTLHAMTAELSRREEGARQMSMPLTNIRVKLGYMFDALHTVGYVRDATTDAMARYLLALQDEDGAWKAYVPRGPIEDLAITSTAWSIRAVQTYPPTGQEHEVELALNRARGWLEAQRPELLNDRVFQLLGLAWSNASLRQMRPFAEALVKSQRADGSWTQLSTLPGDAWATGSALVALHKAGVHHSHPAYQRGVDFLLRTQFDDGSWWVRSRSWPTQPHFDVQFPHGKDQWISAAGTSWAMIALLLTLERTVDPSTLPKASELITAFGASADSASSARHATSAAESNASPALEPISFTRDIQPILERSCVGCHSGARPKSGFNLTTRETLLKGGQSREPAVLPGSSADSRLVHYASGNIEDLEMPPLDRREKYPALSAQELELLQAWINAGVPWPADASIHVKTEGL